MRRVVLLAALVVTTVDVGVNPIKLNTMFGTLQAHKLELARDLAELDGCHDAECEYEYLQMTADEEGVSEDDEEELVEQTGSMTNTDVNATCEYRQSQETGWKPARKAWVRRENCFVTRLPQPPYPADMTTWREKRNWRRQNRQAWRSYV